MLCKRNLCRLEVQNVYSIDKEFRDQEFNRPTIQTSLEPDV